MSVTVHTNARATDPLTSQASAPTTAFRTSQKNHLLTAFVGQRWGLTADEAAEKTALTDTGYWKRVSDLLRDGFLTVKSDEDVRPGNSGRVQRVLYITPKGEQHVQSLTAQ